VSSRDYHESVWQALPEGAVPSDLELRRAFVIGRLLAAAGGSGIARLRVLDVGCGEGQLTAAIAEAGFDVLGIDVAEEPLRRAHALHPGLELLRVEPDGQWPLPDASFDAVWAGETIEHVTDTAGWLSQLRRLLRSGGRLLLSTPAHGPLTRLGVGVSARRFERRFDPRSDHVRYYTRRMLVELLADFGFEQIETRESGGMPGARRVLLASAVRARF
jgi:2-polyprenyl-3-methyl-5-hydroxy-6-metoxy-1,4-benzoquinol methylase